MREPAHQRIGPLIAELIETLPPDLDRPFAIFGHSFGALVAFELTRALRQVGLPSPKLLIVSGRVAPQLPLRRRPIHALPDAEFRDELRRLDGTPRAVLDHQELMGLYTPIIRADLAVNESYDYRDEPPLDIPLLALGGLDDTLVSRDDLAAWSAQTRNRFECLSFPGGHFFLQSSTPDLLATLTRALLPLQETL